MYKQMLLCVFAAGLLSVTAASAKSYDITIAKTSQAGAVQLPAGEYSLKLKGAEAIFTSVRTGDSYTTATTVENVSVKFESTAVETVESTKGERVEAIDLAGTKTKLRFK